MRLDSTQRDVPARVPCSAQRPNKLACAIEAKQMITGIVRADHIEQAERDVMEKLAAVDNSATPVPTSMCAERARRPGSFLTSTVWKPFGGYLDLCDTLTVNCATEMHLHKCTIV